MGKKLNIIWNMISHYKYVIVIVLGIVVVGFVDDNSFVQRVKYDLQISDIKDQIKAYDETYAKNAEALHELKRDPKTIEKIAREKYFMKTDDEDVFVLSDDVQFTKDDETTGLANINIKNLKTLLMLSTHSSSHSLRASPLG